MNNMVLSCRYCNHIKGPLTYEEFEYAKVMGDQKRKQMLKQIHKEIRGE